VDLNSDLGEGFGQWTLGEDDALLRIVTSANVACGFHAGDASIMRRVCEQAVQRGVCIGAQVGYRDLAGFGRRFIDIEPAALTQDVIYQIGALEGFARVAGSRVAYVKPHGALYNAIVHSAQQAAAVVQALVDYDRTLFAVGLPGSLWLQLAEDAGLPVIRKPSPTARIPRRQRWSHATCPARCCMTPTRSRSAASPSRPAARSPTSTVAS
jgi:UPF0271 protein